MGRQLRNYLVVAAAVGLPLLGQWAATSFGLDDYSQGILFKIALNITLAVGLSLIIGFAGQFSLGHAGFMSIGAFFSALFSSRILVHFAARMDPEFLNSETWTSGLVGALFLIVSLGAGVLSAMVASILIGLPTLRLRGDYLAIATMGLGEVVYNFLLIHLQGQYSDTAYYLPIELSFMSRSVNVASSWIVALLAILIVRNLVSSTCGRALPAIREDELGASSVGIRTTRYKLLAFVIGSMIAGAAGVLEAHQTLIMNPGNYRFDRSIEVIVPVVLGGSGSLTGCVLAAGLFTYLLERLRDWMQNAQQYRTIVYATVLVLIMILRPQGLLGRWELADLWVWLRSRRERTRPESATTAITQAAIHRHHDASEVLSCSDIGIRFGGLIAVQRFNLCLKPGEIVGLIGPNGAGKTTCFNMITGVYRPTQGDIRLGDSSLLGCRPDRVNRQGIARTFQNIRLFSDLTVLDNVRVAQHAHLETGIAAAMFRTKRFYREETEMSERALRLLDVFDLVPKAGLVAGSLPYGDQRRLEIARALATRPKVLCLDEPAAGMNPAEKKVLMELIRRVRDRFQLAILLIEHDMKVVMGVCERILVLDHGESIAEGSPEEIRFNSKVIEAYLGEPMKT